MHSQRKSNTSEPQSRKALRELDQGRGLRLPEALTPLTMVENWLNWIWRDHKKIPRQSLHPRKHAKVDDSTTWSSYEDAVRAENFADGIGFVLLNSGFAALDLDDCRDADTGRLEPWATDLIEQSKTYVEVTPSRTGLRIIGLANGVRVHCHQRMPRGKVEVYRNCERYITVTGDEHGRCKQLANIDPLIDKLASNACGDPARVSIEDVRHDWLEVCRRRKSWLVERLVANVIPKGKRSHVIWKISMTLIAKGATPGEVACVLRASACWRSKHGDNEQALKREIERAFRKHK
jgi:hypothetical protein